MERYRTLEFKRDSMKAVTFSAKGPPPVFELIDIDVPTPREDEVLVRVHATSVNSWDWELTPKEPSRVVLGGRADKRYRILGCDVAGTVEAVGKEVRRFKPGDAVFGDLSNSGFGGFAEYTCAREGSLMTKPASMTFEEAAATPQAGLLALHGLRKRKAILAGERILINGAGGGVGTFAIQIAKSHGAEVTGVDRSDKFDMMRSIRADHVLDYREVDFTAGEERYDLILDPKMDRSMFAYRRVLRPGGNYVVVGGKISRIMPLILFGWLVSLFGSRKLSLLLLKQNRDLDLLIGMIEAGKVRPIIDRTFPLTEVDKAIAWLGDGHVKGKVVVTIGRSDDG
jgi:NADPH:quinone reductase-like Zn-dependent oxidoreductase